MSRKLEDKVALVTGASRGIGEAIARGFAREGAKLVLASRKQEGLETVAQDIGRQGGEAFAVACHTGQPEQIRNLIEESLKRFGRIDVLLNNAATNPYFGPLIQTESAAWDKTFEVNVRGYFELARQVILHLMERGSAGSIINVASILGQHAAPLQGVYGMTKAAVISMTKTLAVELGATGIRVNAIAPGLIETKFSAALVGDPSLRKMIEERTPQRRIGKPEELVEAAIFLASDGASFVNGETLVVDGGLTAGHMG